MRCLQTIQPQQMHRLTLILAYACVHGYLPILARLHAVNREYINTTNIYRFELNWITKCSTNVYSHSYTTDTRTPHTWHTEWSRSCRDFFVLLAGMRPVFCTHVCGFSCLALFFQLSNAFCSLFQQKLYSLQDSRTSRHDEYTFALKHIPLIKQQAYWYVLYSYFHSTLVVLFVISNIRLLTEYSVHQQQDPFGRI